MAWNGMEWVDKCVYVFVVLRLKIMFFLILTFKADSFVI